MKRSRTFRAAILPNFEALEEPGDIKKRSSDVEALEHEDGSVAHMGDDKGAVSCKRQEHENKPQERQFKNVLLRPLGSSCL